MDEPNKTSWKDFYVSTYYIDIFIVFLKSEKIYNVYLVLLWWLLSNHYLTN